MSVPFETKPTHKASSMIKKILKTLWKDFQNVLVSCMVAVPVYWENLVQPRWRFFGIRYSDSHGCSQ